jgi:hypothetical protein
VSRDANRARVQCGATPRSPNGVAVAYIIHNPFSGWTAHRTSGATIGHYATPYQAMSAAVDATRTA